MDRVSRAAVCLGLAAGLFLLSLIWGWGIAQAQMPHKVGTGEIGSIEGPGKNNPPVKPPLKIVEKINSTELAAKPIRIDGKVVEIKVPKNYKYDLSKLPPSVAKAAEKDPEIAKASMVAAYIIKEKKPKSYSVAYDELKNTIKKSRLSMKEKNEMLTGLSDSQKSHMKKMFFLNIKKWLPKMQAKAQALRDSKKKEVRKINEE